MTWHNRADRAPAPPHPGPPSRWPADSLGESLVLVGDLENRRAELEERFPPLANPRAGTTDRATTRRDHRHRPPCRDSGRRTLEEPARPGRNPPRAARAMHLEGRRPPGRIPHPRRPQGTHGPRMAPRSHRRPSTGSARQPSPAPRCSPQPLSPGPAGPPRPDGRRSSKPRCPTSPARSPSPAHRNRPDRTAARQAAAPLPPMLRHRAAPDRPCPRPDLRRSPTA